jgi:hypothetical protein
MLQEAQLHQDAYHQGMRLQNAAQPNNNTDPTSEQRMQIDQALFHERSLSYLAANQELLADIQRTEQAGLRATSGQGAYIQTLGNAPAVLHELFRNHNEFRKLIAAGDSPKAKRIIDNISQRLLGDDEEVPQARKTSAPRPPSPVGGASSRGFDPSDESLSTEEWARQRNQDRRRRGLGL